MEPAYMNSIFYTVITLLLLTAVVLLLMREFNKSSDAENTHTPAQPERMSKEEGRRRPFLDVNE